MPKTDLELVLSHMKHRASELLSGGKAVMTIHDEILAGQHEVEDDGFITTTGLE